MDIDGALEKLYRNHIQLFISIARYNFGMGVETGMGRIQETFVKVWSNRHRINTSHEAGVRSYALKVFRNTCIDYLRRRKAPAHVAGDGCHRPPSHTIEGFADCNADTLNEILLVEEMRLQSVAVEQIAPKYREVVRLSLQGMKPRQIAQRLDIKSTTLKNLKHRGLKLFQKELRKVDPDRTAR
jgi:RNA polymerase sigma factor (sigma-70 family)